jgi:alpha-amylase/alpha-mannosidase (GH57 family)
MKKLFVVMFVNGGIALSAHCQKLNESQVPSAVRTAFDKKYPHTKPGWDKEDANYEANFKQEGKAMSVVIDRSGTIVETETNIPVADLPKAIQEYMKKNYGGIKIEEAARIVKANGDINYEAEVHHKDIVFDANGKFIKEMND